MQGEQGYVAPAIADYGGLRALTAVAHPLLAGAGAHGGTAQDLGFSGSSAPPPSYGGSGGVGAAHAHGHGHAAHHGAHHRHRPSRHANRPHRRHGFTG
jgi:hypothetical protein